MVTNSRSTRTKSQTTRALSFKIMSKYISDPLSITILYNWPNDALTIMETRPAVVNMVNVMAEVIKQISI